jgi:hypothetical protein
MPVREYMRLAEQFLGCFYKEELLHLSGLKENYETEAIFAAFPQLFTHEAVRDRLSQRSSRADCCLAEFAIHGYMERCVRDLTEEISNREATACVVLEKDSLPFRSAYKQLTIEPDHTRRHTLEMAIARTVAEQNDWRLARVGLQREVVKEFGFSNCVALCEEVSGQSLHELAANAQKFLDATETAYQTLLSHALTRAGIPSDEATDADLRWLRLAPQFESLFPFQALLPAARETMYALGMSLEDQHNVHLDLEARPNKYPRPFCCPVAVPQEIWVVVSPFGGCADFLTFFHEFGHAEYFAHISPDLPFPYRILGDKAVTEAFAFLFQAIIMKPAWLQQVMGFKEIPVELLEAGRLLNLSNARRCYAKLVFELELLGSDAPIDTMDQRYAQLLNRALHVRVAPENYLFDLDDAFYCATYLRAWRFDAAIRAYLRAQYGANWFFSPAAGDWLRQIWRQGQQYTAEEFAQSLNLPCGETALFDALLS